MTTPKIRIVPISSLILDDKNANKGTKRGRELLSKSLDKYGAGRSVLIDRKNRVIAGNKTIEAARAKGMKNIAVIESSGDTMVAVLRSDLDLKRDKRARELAIADNRVSEIDLAWNPEVLADLDVDLKEFWNESELQKVLGDFAPPLEEAPEPQLDRAAELQRKWKTKLGQIWEIGKHRLMCGDCTQGESVKALLSGHTPNLCVTDPPYGVEYDPGWRNDAAQAGAKSMRGAPGGRAVGKVTNDDRADWTESWKNFPGNVMYVWHGALHSPEVAVSIYRNDFTVRAQIVWSKNRLVISRGHYHWQHEPCWYAVRNGATAKWIGDRSQSTIWEIEHIKSETGHGTQKPLECMARPIRNHEGDVYEPFAGSGTTICAAETLKRRCFAMEIEPKYVAVTLERLSDMGLKPKLAKA